MNRYTATVIRTGNSIALRVPKQYVEDANISPGDKVEVGLPTKRKAQDHKRIAMLIERLQQLHAYSTVTDPVSWQRQVRADRKLPERD
ncbi:MAG TPA: hypothetical protein VMW69_01140 [Spirochaetia bacterium]|nr:hypothetical protein [Spirochaetia bacterium]